MNNETACINNLDTAEWSLINLEMIEMSQGTKMIVEFVEMNWVKEKIYLTVFQRSKILYIWTNQSYQGYEWFIHAWLLRKFMHRKQKK